MHPRQTRSIVTRINTLVSRAVLHKTDSEPGVQTLQLRILADEDMQDVEHVEPYGFTSSPLSGAEGVVLNVAGRRGACVGINFGNRNVRVTGLKSGEVCIFTDEGDKITLKRDRHIKIETLHLEIEAQEDVTVDTKIYTVNAAQSVRYNTPQFALGGEGGCDAAIEAEMSVTGGITQTGGITSSGDHIAGGISQVNHTHTGDSGGMTGKPQ
ncbi:MAG: phage baseplate assembly protein V [Desulfovibrio sp.]|jgi:phage baseplate assembly protein V|nr:phage baseplate assembly protein V [Desulfovibrio sp.]